MSDYITRRTNTQLSNYAIALCLPIFTEDKVEKFKKLFVDRVIHKIRPELTEENVMIPLVDVDGVKKSCGCAFIDCKGSIDVVRDLVYRGNNARFDRNTVVKFVDKDTFEATLSDKNKPKDPEGLPDAPRPQHSQWFAAGEKTLFDQIMFLSNSLPNAVWFNYTTASLEPIPLPGHIKDIEDFKFTADGSFLVAKEKSNERIRVFFGEDWISFNYIDFWKLKDFELSPCGRYILCKTDYLPKDNTFEPLGAAVFNIHYGNKVLRIPLDQCDYKNLVFGAESVIIHMKSDGTLTSYSGKEYANSKEITTGIMSFKASPAAKMVATFRQGTGAAPPRITFFETDSGEQIHMMPNHNAVSAEAYWHPTKAMCAYAIQSTDKKGYMSTISLFDLTEKKSVKTYKITDIKGDVLSCSWEPTSNHVAVVTKVNATTTITIYDITGNAVDKVIKCFPTSGTRVQWSPSGRFAIADDIAGGSVNVQFFDLYEKGLIKALSIEGITAMEWDQSGMFAMASGKGDFQIFMLDGVQILKKAIGGFKKAVWRPRMIIKDSNGTDDSQILEENARFCQFGTVDAKSREQDLKEQKKKNFRAWQNLLASGQQGIPPKVFETTIQLTKPEGGNEENE